jgi:hypothetical protein
MLSFAKVITAEGIEGLISVGHKWNNPDRGNAAVIEEKTSPVRFCPNLGLKPGTNCLNHGINFNAYKLPSCRFYRKKELFRKM